MAKAPPVGTYIRTNARLDLLEARTLCAAAPSEPAFKDFMGINTHAAAGFTVALYRPVVGLVRDYHNFNWDAGTDSSRTMTFPYASNGVNWDNDYGKWAAGGFKIDSSIQVENFSDAQWKNPAADAYKYGRAFASYFGPTIGTGTVSSVEIGNEPGNLSDSVYLTIFRNMAQAIRDVDPAIKIVTCNLTAGASTGYAKSVSLFAGLENLVDVYNVHTYPFINGYPTWERSYPEDARLADYYPDVQKILNWRDAHDPTAQAWVTEFGYDTTTKPNPTTGTFSKMMHVTDLQMAQFTVRSWLGFSAMNVDRAYLFYYNDSDSPTLFAGSGLTRNFTPKPAYYASAHLQSTLGDYKFSGMVRASANGLYVYAYERATDPKDLIYAVWSATGNGATLDTTLTGLPGNVTSAVGMPTTAAPAPAVSFTTPAPGSVRLTVGEGVTYLKISVNGSIAGTVFNDLNGNGVKDSADVGVAGRTVYDDLNNNAKLDAGEPSVLTNTSGSFVLSKLPGGTHVIRQVLPAGWTQTTPSAGAPITVNLTPSGTVTGKLFGTTTPTTTAVYQAETAILTGGTIVRKTSSGYNGTGFADFGGNGSATQWNFSTPSAGTYTLTFRYANGSTVPRPLTVYVNGVSVASLLFASTKSWNTWALASKNVTLKSGFNTVKLVAGPAGGPNIDQLTVAGVATTKLTSTFARAPLSTDSATKLLTDGNALI